MAKFILSALLFAFVAVGAARADVDMTKPLDLKFTAIDGRKVDLATLRGKVVIIDFWATWCPPCRVIAPDLVKLYKKFHSQGLEIVGVSVDSDLSGLAKVVKDEGLVWPQFCDGQGADSAIATKFDIQQFPTMFLLNKQGVVVNRNLTDLWAHDGTLDRVTTPATMQKVEAVIRKQLDAP